MTVLLSGVLCFLVNIPVLAEEQGMAAISEDNELGMLVAGEDSSFEQEEMSGEESCVIDDNDKEGAGQPAAFGESSAETLREKIENADVTENGKESGVDEVEPLGNSVNEADTAVHEGYEEAQIPVSSELEQTASGMCIQKNEEDIEEKVLEEEKNQDK